MPTYDYQCRKCGHRFELFHSIKDDTPKRCPRCKGRAVRVPTAGAGILFKGSGFYITDYRSRDYQKKAKEESGPAAEPAKDAKESKPSKPGKEKPAKGKESGSKSAKGSGS